MTETSPPPAVPLPTNKHPRPRVFFNRAVKEEEHSARLALIPYLQAEQDYRYTLRETEFAHWEEETMKGVEGWQMGKKAYNSENKTRWMPPALDTMPRFS
eukprot:SAG22_NODE_14932_length_361_cov_0.984733_1_plen_99_part_10